MNSIRCGVRCGVFAVALATLASSAGADEVTVWNEVLMQAIRTDKTPPPKASRAMAMVHAAMFDAVNSVGHKYEAYAVDVDAPEGMSRKAAAACAARDVLVALYPNQAATFDARLADSLKHVKNGQGKTDGMSVGQTVASGILAMRANDHSGDIVDYIPKDGPGFWKPTPPGNAPALLPNWPMVTPFAMNSGDQFRGAGPAALDSQAWADAFNQVKELGAKNSQTRTADQTEIAHFWADGGGTETPPGHWNQIARTVATQEGNSLLDNARLFAMLNVAAADAAIVSWDNKYEYEFWRPVTAIREDGDGRDDTEADPNWESLIVTPPFPEYTSGHSTFSGAAAEILAHFFGSDEIEFVTGSDGLPGVYREFSSFSEAAEEAALSRLYGGIHFSFSNLDGLDGGMLLGQYVAGNYFRPIPAPGLAGVLVLGLALGAGRRR
jgi:hypothetical protein